MTPLGSHPAGLAENLPTQKQPMLRLFSQHGVRVTACRMPKQHCIHQFRRCMNGSAGAKKSLFESGAKQEEGASRPKANRNWSVNDNDRLWDHDHVHNLDTRLLGLTKDLGDFKGEEIRVHKSIGGELARAMEKGFGEMNTNFARLDVKIDSIKSDFKLTRWQVHLLFAGTGAAVLVLFGL